MGVKKIVTDRLDKARSFSESVKRVYEDAYKKAIDTGKGGFGGLIKDIEPKFRNALDEGLHSAQVALDNLNQSLADKAIPAFRKRAVSKEKLDYKAKEVVKDIATKAEPVRTKRVVKKTGVTKKTVSVKRATSVKKKSVPASSRKKLPAKK